MVKTPIYLDNLATTPVDPRVVDAMLPYFTDHFGNAASQTHAFGWKAAEAVDQGRGQVASLINARSPREIIFTSGATEANNLAIKGVVEYYRDKGSHLVTCAIEHKSVLDCCKRLEQQGYEVTYLPVNPYGCIDVAQLRAALTERTVLISIMAANNEIGTIQPLRAIGEVAKENQVLWHCDAAQAVGKIDLDVESLGVDLLSLSAHKIYGPKGIGALYVRSRKPRVRLQAQIEGGGQERNLRSGTLNVPGTVGLGQVCQLCQEEMKTERTRLVKLREHLYQEVTRCLDGVRLNGHPQERLPGCLNVSFVGVNGASLLTGLRDVALSAGSACTSGTNAPSHVLKALGVPHELAQSSLRFGLGRFTTREEVDYVVKRIIEEADRLRALSSFLEGGQEG